MKYAVHRSRLKRGAPRSKEGSKKNGLILLLVVIFVVSIGLFFFLKHPKDKVLEAEVTDEGSGDQVQVEKEVFGENTTFQEIDIYYTASGHDAGFARRNIDDGVFTHVMVADLPMIDLTTQYYEGWLVRPGVTEFFSTGEMFAREDGKFGLIWEQDLDEGQENIFAFTRVVITRESRDENSSPSPTHVAEGEF